jgi:SAM-dependent methyltransferase
MNDSASDYRSRIYERYASRFQSAPPNFDLDAARRWGRAYRHYLRGWLPNDRGACILDVACGGGKLLQFFLDAGFRDVHGVDVSPEQVALSRQVTPNVVRANVLEYLAEQSGRFDLITGLDIVEHFRKDEVLRFLDRCYAALKPGGPGTADARCRKPVGQPLSVQRPDTRARVQSECARQTARAGGLHDGRGARDGGRRRSVTASPPACAGLRGKRFAWG